MLVTASKSLQVAPEASYQIVELVQRLEAGIFSGRPENSSRRQDGEIALSHPETSFKSQLQIRLNAYSIGKSAVVNFCIQDERVEATALMIRERAMGGDDRGLVAIPQLISPEDLVTADKLLFGACQCVARGTVTAEEPANNVKTFRLYLPSLHPLPHFGQGFELLGLPPRY